MPELKKEEITLNQLRDVVFRQASTNPKYRQELLADPKELIAKQVGHPLPSNMNVKVVEETSNTIYLVLPYAAPNTGELSEYDLQTVSGGTNIFLNIGGDTKISCDKSTGALNTFNDIEL